MLWSERDKSNLEDCLKRFCEAHRVSESTVQFKALGTRKFLTRMREGQGYQAASMDKLIGYLSDNWPEDIAWPDGIDRPTSVKKRSKFETESHTAA